jgi:hypothetical protein
MDLWSDMDAFRLLLMLLTRNDPGHMLQLLLPATYGDYEFGWQELYGPVYRLKGCFGVSTPRLHCRFSDPFTARSIDGLRRSSPAVHFE